MNGVINKNHKEVSRIEVPIGQANITPNNCVYNSRNYSYILPNNNTIERFNEPIVGVLASMEDGPIKGFIMYWHVGIGVFTLNNGTVNFLATSALTVYFKNASNQNTVELRIMDDTCKEIQIYNLRQPLRLGGTIYTQKFK